MGKKNYPTNQFAATFLAQNRTHFNTPGHRKRGTESTFRKLAKSHLLELDMIDVNVLESSVLNDVTSEMAKAYKADRSILSTQGTSTAIMAMILATCNDGGRMIVPRNVHRSVIAGIILAGAEPLFLETEFDNDLGISNHYSAKSLLHAVNQYTNIQAILLINPTYFGVCTDLKTIVSIAHEKRIPVIVDEAHGAHLPFHPQLPISAMEAGADLAATSLHKLGGSMNQTSILLYREGLVDFSRVQHAMNYLLSTSRPFQLIASLDSTRYQLERQGRLQLQKTLALADDFLSKVNTLTGISCPTKKELLHSGASFDLDRSKVIIKIDTLPLSGYQLKDLLEKEYTILLELADTRYALAVFTIGTKKKDAKKLYTALKKLVARYQETQPSTHPVVQPPAPIMSMTPRKASFSPQQLIPLTASLGKINTEFVISYPPGIPILIPGERITQQHMDFILNQRNSGATFVGSQHPKLEELTVIEEKT
ncbi:aminotransferase class I/II-fold pyridoxal phosphate-dependent enzyme [Shouchella miscanthi]|uniref:Aminotransferase class I/II-fold pyridoxal phosphate-dependent enzyme n=1 Tax=Shouchella miscanthi TaxID=2598861 RepID=A0ABU6NQY3_9BACI|nr:aminotransferase class I/II-fold pyridoxal phosphate-dependent enzyme [Shouchella miscanthi]MED4130134.1 aminotransferase class I/II-fold pyridoxal phosphate-dependent enzyme [Shouchella miscanthi]